MPRQGRAGLVLRCVLAVATATFSVGQKEEQPAAAAGAAAAAAGEEPAKDGVVLAELDELSESLGHLFDDEKRDQIRSMIGKAIGDWKTDDALEKTIRDSGSPCTVRRLKAGEVPSQELFEGATEPLVFRSAEVDQWKALRKPWTRLFLREKYGRSTVMPRSMQVLAHMMPDRKDTGGVLQLKHFAILDSNRSIFDRSWMNASQFEEEDDLQLVDELWDDEEWGIPTFLENFTEERGLSIGPSGHGFPFHQQAELWQVQVIGKKLWMLHPPRGLPTDWEIAHPRNIFKKALAKETCPQMQHCLLEPGDVLFLPKFWYHGTLNVGDAIGLGGNRDVWSLPDEEVTALAEAERGDLKDRNALILDVAAVRFASNKNMSEALKDSKMAHIARPGDPYIARRFAELLLATKKNTTAAQVVNRYINRTMTLYAAGWMDDQEMSGILTLVAHPLVANSFGYEEVERLTQKALVLVKKAARLDPNNWQARIMAAHHYLLLDKLESSFKLLYSFPAKSMAVDPAVGLILEMCTDMPEQYADLEKRFCAKNWQVKFGKESDEDEEGGEEEGGEEGGEEEPPSKKPHWVK